jgi:hypothetical protein
MLLAATVILRPFPAPLRPADYGGLANMTLHRATCASIFLFSLLSVIAHTAPGIAYIVVYHRAAPNLPADTRAIGIAHVVAIFGTLVAAGCMRRGPRLRATEFRVGGAFGLRDASPPKPWWEENAGQDVVDYSNCSMLTFLTLGYVST